MRNKWKNLLVSVMFLTIATAGVACGQGGGSNSGTSTGTSVVQPMSPIKLTYTAYELDLYSSFKLTCTNYDDATFTSNDENIAIVDATGKVTAIGCGATDIVVKVDKLSATCRITVNDGGIIPVIELNLEDKISMNMGQNVSVVATTIFKGEAQETEFAYASSNKEVFTVSNSGLIKPVGYGSALLTISTTFAGKSLEKVVAVEVLRNSEIVLSQYNYEVATNTVLGGTNSFTLDPVVYVNGTEVANADVTYTYDDTIFAKVGETFTVLESYNADCETVVEISYDTGDMIVTTQANVKVSVPNEDLTTAGMVYADTWRDAERNIVLGVKNYTFNYEFSDGSDITKVYCISSLKPIDLEYENGFLKLDHLEKGIQTWKVYSSENYTHTITVQVVDKVITSNKQFKLLTANATDEHIVLGKDLSLVGECINNGNVFSGIFDGNYHTVSGVIIGNRECYDYDDYIDKKTGELTERRVKTGGLFHTLNGATIKNCSFVDSKISVWESSIEKVGTESLRSGRAFFAYKAEYSVIENVNLELENLSGTSEAGFVSYTGVGLRISDVVLKMKWDGSSSKSFAGLAFQLNSRIEFDNVFLYMKDGSYPFSDYKGGYDKSKITITSDMFLIKFAILNSNTTQMLKDMYKAGDNTTDDDFGTL